MCIWHREICFIHGRVYERFIRDPFRSRAVQKPWKRPRPRDSSAKHKLSVAGWQTAAMKQYRKSEIVIPPSAVSLKKIYRRVCRVVWNIYPDTPAAAALRARRSRKFSTHKRTQHVRACRRFNRSPLDEPAMHIKQESQSPEGGKHTRDRKSVV